VNTIGQLIVWNGVTLVASADKEWLWGSSTHVFSVAAGDVVGDGKVEVVNCGAFYDNVRNNFHLVV
jgi:hypothetical protein